MTAPEPKCMNCAWLDSTNEEGIACRAYPKGIPDDILEGGAEHDQVRPDQEGIFTYLGLDQ